ncbi:hypothetical protein [Desulfoplanes formicivorans]|uniref:HTH merR-type domain-containing protein n=1 Tax=Desulfoplanes formicivorans TaxID=1592317 RepID=A0A194AGX2_9BACT|nr:hypothetical protein [Desulfoplanes formicivorans]GAU08460.1 hypothetical protein DPF_1170 [Desulfoplanes formicivorans]
MNDWLSLTAMARRLQIPEPTARRYAKLFSDYLPHRKVGRMTLYAPDAGPILTRISQLYSDGHKKDEVEALLKQELPKTIDVASSPLSEGRSLVRSDNSVLQEKLFQFLEIVSDQSRKIDALMERDNQTSATIARLQEELATEKARRETLEKTSAQYKQALCTLYRGYKDHHALIQALRDQPLESGSNPAIDRISNRLTQLEDMFLEDMGKLQKMMNHVLKSQ